MSGPFGSSQWMYSSGEAESQSLRFNDDDSAYLEWTPASAGNRKTWTWSGWVKRGNIGAYRCLFSANDSADYGANGVYIWFTNTDTLAVSIGSGTYYLDTNAVFRDNSAWYHVVASVDTTQATSSDRINIYVNGEQQTSFGTSTYPTLNYDTSVNNTQQHTIGSRRYTTIDSYFDGYLSEVNFVDGTALDPTSFGETDANGKWVPIIAPDVTYGSNGFYLPFTNDYEVEGFNAVTYRGTGAAQYIGGVGFEPDLLWIKNRSAANYHFIVDSVRGNDYKLRSNTTGAESLDSDGLTSFDPDGFSVLTDIDTNASGQSHVAWAWDAGTGSAVSNTDGSITSSVKANPDYGFSIVSYTGTGAAATVGHGLGSAPEMVIAKSRSVTGRSWAVYNEAIGASNYLALNQTSASASATTVWNSTAPTSSVFSIGNNTWTGASAEDYIAYCFHSVSGYSDFGSYTGNGSTTGPTVTTGFKPAFVMIKRTSDTGHWYMYDSTRDPVNSRGKQLYANLSNAEADTDSVDFLSDGFQLVTTASEHNQSGQTYIYMAFADKREAAFWLDQSGNNNDWTNNNMQESDISLDSPTNNFATLNPLDKTTRNVTLSEGNLKTTDLGGTAWYAGFGSMGVNSGKYYFEVLADNLSVSLAVGVVVGEHSSFNGYNYPFGKETYKVYQNGFIYHDNAAVSYMPTYATGDILAVAIDADSREIWVSKNGVFQGSPTLGTGGVVATDGDPMPDGAIFPMIDTRSSSSVLNFGQDSSFAGNKVAQGYQDANGKGDFYYEPPSGYLALCTDNLPAPAIADGSEYFNTLLYTGDGTSARGITGAGFAPDFTWIKKRNTSVTGDHILFDKIRGATKYLWSNLTNQEGTLSSTLSSFDADGFTLGNNAYVNNNSDTYAAWNWKANGTGVSNTDGSITSTVSANTTAGFSIVSWNATSTSATIGHGLGVRPDLVIMKTRDSAIGWPVQCSALGDMTSSYLLLNTTNAKATGTTWSDATTTTFGTSSSIVKSGDDYIAYCFHNVEGYSKFGSYTGNGSTDGPFVYTGFRPAFVMVKSATSSLGSWMILDSVRDPDNVAEKYLHPNLSNAEGTTNLLDFTSNGFKWRYNGASGNSGSVDYIYMAFAETPFKYSNAR